MIAVTVYRSGGADNMFHAAAAIPMQFPSTTAGAHMNDWEEWAIERMGTGKNGKNGGWEEWDMGRMEIIRNGKWEEWAMGIMGNEKK